MPDNVQNTVQYFFLIIYRKLDNNCLIMESKLDDEYCVAISLQLHSLVWIIWGGGTQQYLIKWGGGYASVRELSLIAYFWRVRKITESCVKVQ